MLHKLDLVGQKYVEVSWIWSVKLYVKSTGFGRVKICESQLVFIGQNRGSQGFDRVKIRKSAGLDRAKSVKVSWA